MDIYWLASLSIPAALLLKRVVAFPPQPIAEGRLSKCGFNPRFMEAAGQTTTAGTQQPSDSSSSEQ